MIQSRSVSSLDEPNKRAIANNIEVDENGYLSQGLVRMEASTSVRGLYGSSLINEAGLRSAPTKPMKLGGRPLRKKVQVQRVCSLVKWLLFTRMAGRDLVPSCVDSGHLPLVWKHEVSVEA